MLRFPALHSTHRAELGRNSRLLQGKDDLSKYLDGFFPAFTPGFYSERASFISFRV